MTYRWREHCGPNEDTSLGYRSQGELDAWAAHDPLLVARRRLLAASTLARADIDAMEAEIAAETDTAFERARQAPN